MMFTTPCFVRIEDAKERKKLFEWLYSIGYSARYRINPWCPIVIAGLVPGCADVAPDDALEGLLVYGLIDCGDDIELFKALAAMNDENDRDQWFVSELGDWYKSAVNDFWDSYECGCPECWCKATAEEIVGYFKNKR